MSEPKPIKITMNKLVEDMARKNPKFRKFLQDKKSGRRIRTQPKLPGFKTGSPETFAEMQPYGGKYAKKKKEMTATAAQNVKRLMTQPDAYDPETRYIQGFQKKGNRIRVASKKTTDATNLKAEAAKMKADLGKGSRVGIFETPMRVSSRGFEPIRYTPRNRKKGKRVQMPVRPMPQPPSERPKKKFKNGGESTIKTVAAKLKKASKAHAGQAKALENVVKKKGGGLMDYYKDIL